MAPAVLITPSVIAALNPGLLALAERTVHQREMAEDLVQETWISALHSMPTFEGRSTLRTWLNRILRRRIADRFRREHPCEPLIEDLHVTTYAEREAELDTVWLARQAGDALSGLTEQERRAITLCDVEDVDRDAASAAMGVTRGHLRVLLHRGRHKLKASLRRRGGPWADARAA